MFGAAQSWHWPVVENVVFTQLMHSVLSALGPVPAPHAEQVVRSLLTTFGALHSTHSMPNVEYSIPLHASHVERSSDGALPAVQLSQNVWAALATLPAALHAWHGAPVELTVPTGHGLQSP